jgi:hypothetical protein
VGKREANDPEHRPFDTCTGTAFHSTNVRRSFVDATGLLGDVPVECSATRNFRPHIARRSAVTVVFHYRDASAADTIAMLDHSDQAQLPANVPQISPTAPDFSVITALDKFLPILDESTP